MLAKLMPIRITMIVCVDIFFFQPIRVVEAPDVYHVAVALMVDDRSRRRLLRCSSVAGYNLICFYYIIFPSIFNGFSRFHVLLLEVFEVLRLIQPEELRPLLQRLQLVRIQRPEYSPLFRSPRRVHPFLGFAHRAPGAEAASFRQGLRPIASQCPRPWPLQLVKNGLDLRLERLLIPDLISLRLRQLKDGIGDAHLLGGYVVFKHRLAIQTNPCIVRKASKSRLRGQFYAIKKSSQAISLTEFSGSGNAFQIHIRRFFISSLFQAKSDNYSPPHKPHFRC